MNNLWEEKTIRLSSKVKRIAMGDDDCYQQGILGIRDGLLKDPNGTDSFLLEAAKFSMLNHKSKGKSVDNGSKYPVTKNLRNGEIKTYRKEVVIIPMGDMDIPDRSYMPDVLVMDKVCADNFYRSLTLKETEFINAYSTNRYGNFSDKKTRAKLGISLSEYTQIKSKTHRKFLKAFEIKEM